jgi:predicted DCC family thiol-disulfide oxidoreductase YuxK
MIQGEGSTDGAIRSLTVLYDAACPLCRHVRGWLERQRQLVPLEFVAAGSEQAEQRYPGLDHARTLREITVISDGGEVYEAAEAWVVCLWALKRHRAMSHRLSTPAGARLARGAVLAAAKWREASKGAGAARRGTKVSVRPTAQGRAGRTSPSTPTGPWNWTGQAWQPTDAPRPPAPEAAPCGEHCAAPPG